MARNMILPVVIEEYDRAAEAYAKAQSAGLADGLRGLHEVAAEYGKLVDEMTQRCNEMEKALCGEHEVILEAMRHLRSVVDRAEQVISDEEWPLPKYREMLFIYN